MTKRFEYSPQREAESEAKVKALEHLLIEKGVIGKGTVDQAPSPSSTSPRAWRAPRAST